jgi:pimeloyl-ACP methyl ester carboxylesterase
MPLANINGNEINYKDTGGDKPAIIFSHGFFMNLSSFDPQLEMLKDKYRCISWDERGFGGSVAKENFTYWDSAQDTISLLKYLNIDNAVFAGVSKGGFISLRAYLTNPNVVKGIILIGSDSGTFDNDQQVEFANLTDHWCSANPLGEAGEAVGEVYFGDDPQKKLWIELWKKSDRSNIKYPARALLLRDNITHKLKDIKCPFLIIHGEKDSAITIDKAEALSKRVPNLYKFLRIKDGPHGPNMTHVQETNDAIIDFMENI